MPRQMAASNPQDVGVTVLASVQRAFLENDRALQGKRRLTAGHLAYCCSARS